MLLVWNLGLADLGVGIVVLPLSVGNLIMRKWASGELFEVVRKNVVQIFGRTMCRIWVSCDIIFCTASIITICMISVDRQATS